MTCHPAHLGERVEVGGVGLAWRRLSSVAMRPSLLAVLPLALLVAAGGGDTPAEPTEADEPAALQTATEVAERVSQRFEDNLDGVQGFTVTAAGLRAVYAIDRDTSSLDWLQPEIEAVGDGVVPPDAALIYDQVPNARRFGRGLRAATLDGLVDRDGRQAYRLRTSDPAVLLGEAIGPPPDDGQSLEFSVFVDAETFDVLEVAQTIAIDSLAAPISNRVVYGDFRTTDGLTLPFSVRRFGSGLNQMIPDDQRATLAQQLEAQRNALNAVPEGDERDAALRQLDAEVRLLSEGTAEQTLTVDSVSVQRSE